MNESEAYWQGFSVCEKILEALSKIHDERLRDDAVVALNQAQQLLRGRKVPELSQEEETFLRILAEHAQANPSLHEAMPKFENAADLITSAEWQELERDARMHTIMQHGRVATNEALSHLIGISSAIRDEHAHDDEDETEASPDLTTLKG